MLNFFMDVPLRVVPVSRPRRKFRDRAHTPGLQPLEPRLLLTAAALGVNLEGVSDLSRSFAFADAMKQARHFGSADAPWDEAAAVDANGWPVGDAGATVIMLDNAPGHTPVRIDGTYHFSAIGDITLTPVVSNAVVCNRVYDPLTDTTTADLVVLPGADALHLAFTGDPDGAKDIHLYRPGTVAGQTFTTEFLQSLEGAQTLRLMDFVRANSTDIANWADRAKTTDARQSDPNKGVAWEYAIELANTLHKDLWVNVPAAATDDYVTQMAALFHDTLQPGLHIYLEYSNEVWNSDFWRAFWTNYGAAQNDAAANPADLNYDNVNNPYQIAWRRVAKRLLEIRDIFATAYGGPASINDTLRPVLASQIAWAYVLNDQLGYLQHRFGVDLSSQIYAVAGAPYMSLSSELSNSSTLTVDQVFQGLYQDLANMQAGVQKYEALATTHHVNLLFYESGIDLQGDTGGNFDNAKLPANYDPRMTDLVRSYLTSMFSNGVDAIMYYGHISAYTSWGTWGLTDTVQALDAPKMLGFRAIAHSDLPPVVTGIGLPDSFGGITFDAGNFLMDYWATTGGGGSILGTSAGSEYTYLLNVTSPATWTLQLATASTGADSVVEVFIDGISAGQIALPATPTSDTYVNTAPLALPALAAGHHALKLRIVSGGMNIQSISIGAGGYVAPPPLQPVPPAPANLAASAPGTTQIILTWADVPNETGYRLERSTDATTWGEIAVLPADCTQYTDTGLAPGTKYWYRLRATSAQGSSPYSLLASATTVPLPPTGLNAVENGTSSLTLTWAPTAGAAYYLVQRSTGGKTATWTTVTRVSRTATSYTDYGLSCNTSYSYRLVAVSLEGVLSAASSPVTAKTRKK